MGFTFLTSSFFTSSTFYLQPRPSNHATTCFFNHSPCYYPRPKLPVARTHQTVSSGSNQIGSGLWPMGRLCKLTGVFAKTAPHDRSTKINAVVGGSLWSNRSKTDAHDRWKWYANGMGADRKTFPEVATGLPRAGIRWRVIQRYVWKKPRFARTTSAKRPNIDQTGQRNNNITNVTSPAFDFPPSHSGFNTSPFTIIKPHAVDRNSDRFIGGTTQSSVYNFYHLCLLVIVTAMVTAFSIFFCLPIFNPNAPNPQPQKSNIDIQSAVSVFTVTPNANHFIAPPIDLTATMVIDMIKIGQHSQSQTYRYRPQNKVPRLKIKKLKWEIEEKKNSISGLGMTDKKKTKISKRDWKWRFISLVFLFFSLVAQPPKRTFNIITHFTQSPFIQRHRNLTLLPL